MDNQAPAANPALDLALERLEGSGLLAHAHAATIRDALADRITPAEADRILDWAGSTMTATSHPADVAFLARLGRIADRDEEAGR